MIRADSLTVRFEDFTLSDISFSVEPGESFFLLGPSGAGKTLLLETLLGIKAPERGTVHIGGVDFTQLPPEKRGVAYVPQDLAIFPHLSVRENILYSQRGKPEEETAPKLKRWTELLNLGEVLKRRDVRTLSGGERQRVALARALIMEPRVLFMDEPFSALDASLRRKLQVEFRNLQRTLGLTVVQVTHDPEEAFLMADRMAILIGGRIEEIGKPDDLYNNPANRRVAEFLMLQNLYPSRIGPVNENGLREVDARGVRFLLEEKPGFLEGAQALVGIRPEEIILIRPDRVGEVTPRPNLMTGEITGWVDLGHYRLVRLKVNALELDCWLNIRAAREFPMEVGGRADFHIRPRSFCVLPPDGE